MRLLILFSHPLKPDLNETTYLPSISPELCGDREEQCALQEWESAISPGVVICRHVKLYIPAVKVVVVTLSVHSLTIFLFFNKSILSTLLCFQVG